MKFCRFNPVESATPVEARPLYGLVEGEQVREISGSPFAEWSSGKQAWPLDRIRLLAPVEPSKIVCVGRNYKEHAAEFGNAVPTEMIIFLKPPTSVIGPEESIVLTPLSKRVDHEGELAVIIGRTCFQPDPGLSVRPYILGYTCLNDVTARDLQRADGQWTRGKGFDTFCPIGPFIETEFDVAASTLETRVNGSRRQSAPLTDMVFDIDYIIRFISSVMTLLPGDVIATGTPSGVGPLTPHDIVEVSIAGLGTLRNPVVAPDPKQL